jgi:hypothetical protein
VTDTALENARAKKADLVDKIAQAEDWLKLARAEIQQIDEFITAWHKFAGNEGPPPDAVIEPALTPIPAKNNPKKEAVAEAARKVIQERGRPVPREEMRELLRNKGIEIHGKDADMVLSTMLWRMQSRVIRLKSHGYWLTEVPYDPAGYLPEPGDTHPDPFN